jgi:hypothetical protein
MSSTSDPLRNEGPSQPSGDPMADYQRVLEDHEFMKREGLSAYADLLVSIFGDMLGDKIDPDKLILIKEGLSRLLSGPPPMPAMLFEAPLRIDPDFEPAPPSYYEYTGEDGVITVCHWPSFTEGVTTIERYPSGDVLLYRYTEQLEGLEGAAAESFWQWVSFMRKATDYPNAPAPRAHRRRRNRYQHSATPTDAPKAADSTGGIS